MGDRVHHPNTKLASWASRFACTRNATRDQDSLFLTCLDMPSGNEKSRNEKKTDFPGPMGMGGFGFLMNCLLRSSVEIMC